MNFPPLSGDGLRLRTDGKPTFWVLLDPDRESPSELRRAAGEAAAGGADGLLVGSSFYEREDFDTSVLAVKEGADGVVPVILFPGNHQQVSPHADALLFLCLISGRNPQYLIGEQVLAAPLVRRLALDVLPTGYILIEGGRVTSVQAVTGTTPLPREKTELIAAHALAGQYMGMRLIYLEAGSGARHAVPREAIRLSRHSIGVPLIVGGGIRDPETASGIAEAGADVVVVGNALEGARGRGLTREIADAVHEAGSRREANRPPAYGAERRN
ncbi:MAG TPA: geranylgeranylglyceryl/heptaprenylglyceryl phosphate synthase [Bacteroidetes bacterium]|nr:geranylgeranylglyceryl/heptaprenylglyceryl phosphate synthase [Bacteroidota bacterium]